jgi:small-conductance mechanosensitive channel
MQSDKNAVFFLNDHDAGPAGHGSDKWRITWRRGKMGISGWLVTILLAPLFCLAQTTEVVPEEVAAVHRAPVIFDGETLFLIRGVSAFPAEKRAGAIADRIRAAAIDPGYVAGSLKTVDGDVFSRIEARGQMLVTITNADAAVEGVSRSTLVRVLVSRIDGAIAAYRQARTRKALVQGARRAAADLGAFVVVLFLFLWAYRRGEKATERYFKTRIEKIRVRALPVVRAERVWDALSSMLRFLRAAFLLVASLFTADLVLSQFPWTKPFSKQVFEIVLGPLRVIWQGVVQSLPDLAFLAVLFFVLRYLLRLIRMVFEGVEQGALSWKGFDSEWAGPTFRITRLLVIAFGLIVAYPYLPGSSSDAFKGVSLFIGVIFSLGSSGMIANILAGYSLTYRRAYRVGDRVRIGDTIGDVEFIRLQVTHLRSLKNEEVIIPNSTILNSSVINYTSLAQKCGLILHTTVGIGYDTPWRQVEAMLLVAAERTPGLLREPPPFVLHSTLGDFCITYELNVYCDRPSEQLQLYTALHRNILDVFNEHGVQIMTPAYERDPAEPKVVPKGKWFESPAKPPHPLGG